MPKIYNLTDTWNDGTTVFDAIKINVADTASAAGSKLLDLQIGGVSQFEVDKSGNITNAGTIAGLENVDNTSDLDKPVSTLQATAIGVVQTDVDNHEALTNNPHTVTKAQVGLGNVDNTSDLDKPISTLTQAAIDAAGGGAFGKDANTLITPSTPIVLDQATGDEAALTLDYTTNKAAGNDTGLLINQTDTLSPGTSKLLDLQAGGVSKFRVDSGGEVFGSGVYSSLRLTDSGGAELEYSNWRIGIGGSTAYFFQTTTAKVGMGVDGLRLADSGALRWSSGSQASTGHDLILSRDAAGTLAQRNGVNAQTFNIYNTYTNASNYERGFMKWDSDVLEIGTEAGSAGGTVREWSLGTPNKKVVSGDVAGSPAVVANASYFSARQIVVSNTELSSLRDIWINSTDGVRFKSGLQVRWSSSSTNSALPLDTGIARDSAGVVKVTDGSTGTGYLKLIPTTVGALTAAATVGAGTKAFVTDSTNTLSSHHGQAVVGGGTDFVPVYSDGTTWRVG